MRAFYSAFSNIKAVVRINELKITDSELGNFRE